MVAKQLIKVDSNSTSPLTAYLDTKQTHIAVAKYLKKFQAAAETIKGCEYERYAISDLKVGTHQYIVFKSIDYQSVLFPRLSTFLWHTTSQQT